MSNTLPDLFCSPCDFYKRLPMDNDFTGGISFGADDSLYILSGAQGGSIYQVNIATSTTTLIMNGPTNLIQMGGMVAMGNGIFYSVPWLNMVNDSLYLWNVATDTVISVGELNYQPIGDLWRANGAVYYMSSDPSGLYMVEVNFADPSNCEVVLTLPNYYVITGMTATPVGNVFAAFEQSYFGGVTFVTVNITDGMVTPKCKITKHYGAHWARSMSSLFEHNNNPTSAFIDLDCDDSSLATESDFNALAFDCFTEGGIPVTDTDIKTMDDALISTMTISIDNPPDGEDEILFSTGDISGIIVDGAGTSILTLQSEGEAKISDFEAALLLVRYENNAWNITAGTRIIEVQFETSIGTLSNVARTYIEVNARPRVEVDLGPDLTLCEGSTLLLNAGSVQNTYAWSNGETTSSIEVTEEGVYAVTVSQPGKCPDYDEIEIDELPLYTVSLTGDTFICADHPATLMLNTNANFPVDVEIIIGSESYWYSITNHVLTFTDLPPGNTEYFINAILPSDEACMNADDFDQSIVVYPHYQVEANTSICNGDSVLIGNNWVTLPGAYPITLQSIHGCDSLINLHLAVVPVVEIAHQQTTCDSLATGIFYTALVNPSGCDTLITTTVTYQDADTTFMAAMSCKQINAGISIQSYTSVAGCDSLVIVQTTWDPPADSTKVVQSSCDSAAWGSFPLLLTSVDGCDSIVLMEIIPGQPISISLQLTSCDSASLGVFENHYSGIVHCDSTVTTTVTYAAQDSTFINSTSCDANAVGVFYHFHVNQFGCDSIVSETVVGIPVETTEVFSTTCDSTASGDFTFSLISQLGCDSIVHSHIALLPHHHLFVTETTCHSSEAGVFDAFFINQYGCDSIMTRIVSAVPTDTTIIYRKTCFPDSIVSQSFLLTNQEGCDSLMILNTTLFPIADLSLVAPAPFHGYEISCFGKNDGSISALIQGIGPFELMWSTGSTETFIDELVAGTYHLAVTDANGCESKDSILLQAPEEIKLMLDVQQPTCDEPHLGHVLIHTSGGTGLLQYSLDGIQYTNSNNFDVAAPANYQITAIDENGCKAIETMILEEVNDLNVSLGEDRVVLPGASVTLEAMLNISPDSIVSISWTGGDFTGCGFCFHVLASPRSTSFYSISVESLDGCIASDTVKLLVETENGFDIPNIISPNGDGINDLFMLTTSPDVDEIELVEIFDRWGNMVFTAQHVLSNDGAHSWDGTRNGEAFDPAVFTYRIIYHTHSAEQFVRLGNVTLVW